MPWWPPHARSTVQPPQPQATQENCSLVLSQVHLTALGLSPSRLLVALLAAKAPRLEDSLLAGLRDSVQEIYAARSLHVHSLWFEEEVWRQASQAGLLSPAQLQRLFCQVLQGPMMVEGIASPLLKLACCLVQSASLNVALRGNLASSSLHISTSSQCSWEHPPNAALAASTQGFGAWLLIELFTRCKHARVSIMR